MSLTIDLYAQDGSPLGISPPDIYGRGVGGAELSMMTWAEEMALRGHRVRIYNNPNQGGLHQGAEYLQQGEFEPGAYRDVLICYRSPNPYIQAARAGIKIHWSTDQYTIGDYGRDIVPYVDYVVTISPYHLRYYESRYPGAQGKAGYIDLGVRGQDYQTNGIGRIPYRCIFCSVPERGLTVIAQVWPRILEQIPEASLVITSDHRLWGSPSPNNHQYRLALLRTPGITFLGAIPRKELVRHQQQAQIHLYPCIYEELFCISAAECQWAGVYPITSDRGALKTTNQFGMQIPGNPEDGGWQDRFVATAIDLMRNQAAMQRASQQISDRAQARFRWARIAAEWEHLIETGEFAVRQAVKEATA